MKKSDTHAYEDPVIAIDNTNNSNAELEIVKSLIIVDSLNITSFSLTYGLIKRMNFSLHNLENLVIANNSFSTINICDINADKQQKFDFNLIGCDELNKLKMLDLRNNKLTSMSEFQLTGLEELYLSGNHWECFKETSTETQYRKGNTHSI